MEIWEIAAVLGLNDLPSDEDSDANARPVDGGPNAYNVRRMMAEAKARDEGREFTAADMPAEATVIDLIRGGAKGGFG